MLGVPDVPQAFGRQLGVDRARHGQAAHAGVEDPDRAVQTGHRVISGTAGVVVAILLRVARDVSHAVTMPASAPNRCPCHEIPGLPGSRPSSVLPQYRNSATATANCLGLRLKIPLTSRNAS